MNPLKTNQSGYFCLNKFSVKLQSKFESLCCNQLERLADYQKVHAQIQKYGKITDRVLSKTKFPFLGKAHPPLYYSAVLLLDPVKNGSTYRIFHLSEWLDKWNLNEIEKKRSSTYQTSLLSKISGEQGYCNQKQGDGYVFIT